MTRAEDIAVAAGELHKLLQGATQQARDYLCSALTPKAPYDRRVLGILYQLFCDGKLTAEQGMHFIGRLRDADYGKGTNSYRSQAEIAAQRRCSVDTIQRADAALIKVGLATRKRARRSAAIFTLITPEELDQLFVQVGGELPRSDQKGTLDASSQGHQETAQAMRLQDNSRDRTNCAASKIKKPQNGGLRSRTSYAALPYKDLKKKEARAQTHEGAADDPPIAPSGALRRWIVSGDAGWAKECRDRYGRTPDSFECAIYRLPKAAAQDALNAAVHYVKRFGNATDALVMTRMHTIQRRINAMPR